MGGGLGKTLEKTFVPEALKPKALKPKAPKRNVQLEKDIAKREKATEVREKKLKKSAAAKRKAQRKGGRRSLLSGLETGLGGEQDTLG